MAYSTYSTGLQSTTSVPNLVVTAYDQLFEFGLRAEPLFRQFADKRPAQVTNPGESVVFNLWNDLAPATTPLTENLTPDPVALGNTSQVTVTLNEYGNLTLRTLRLRADNLSSIDEALANALAYNCADSIDSVVQTILRTNGVQVFRRAAGAVGSNKFDGSANNAPAANTVVGTDTIKSSDLRLIVATMRANKVVYRTPGLYAMAMHPYVSADLRAETGAAAWRDPHVYNDSGVANVWAGEIGQYEGLSVVENPRLYSSQAGAGTGGTQTRVFTSYVMGQQAIAEAVNVEFGSVVGETTDPLKRFFPLGWYGFAGWNVFRQAALARYECAASGQPNA